MDRATDAVHAGAKEAEADAIANSVIEEAEVLHASIKTGSIAQIVVAIIAVIGLLYLLKFVMVTILLALLLAFILDPLLVWLNRIGIPRTIGAFLSVVVALGVAGGTVYFLGGRLADFASELPRYSEGIRRVVMKIEEPAKNLEKSTSSVISPSGGGVEPVPVRIQESPVFSRIVTENGSAIGKSLLAISFIPFLTYFMLTWKKHCHSTTVALFPEEHRGTAYRTIAKISAMIRSFLVGNLTIGLIGALMCTSVFWFLRIPYFYFLGFISGFVSLIPSFGVFLALLPPLTGGMGILGKSGIATLLITVTAIHAVTMNVLYPKLIGKRLRLNPLAVVLSLLFWSWIWGGMGLILAVPIVGSAKIACDYIDSLKGLGAWLGD